MHSCQYLGDGYCVLFLIWLEQKRPKFIWGKVLFIESKITAMNFFIVAACIDRNIPYKPPPPPPPPAFCTKFKVAKGRAYLWDTMVHVLTSVDSVEVSIYN